MRLRRDIIWAVLLGVGIFAIAWAWIGPAHLYVCSDSFPPTEFIPPFVDYARTGELDLGDRYLMPAAAVYGLWVTVAAISAVLGWSVARVIRRLPRPQESEIPEA